MMSDEILKNINDTSLSILTDPFNKKSLISIAMNLTKSNLTNKVYISGSVEFKNNMTKGEQRFEADSLESLLLQIKAFIDSL